MEEMPSSNLMGLDDLRGQINWDPLEAERVLNVVIHHLEKQARKDDCLTYCKSELKGWGWTDGAIKKFLDEPDTL